MRKVLLIFVSILLCVLFAELTIVAAESIKIGAVYNVTGEIAACGDPARKGAALAVKQLNEMGGLLGKQIELFVEDGRSQQDTNANAAERLISNNNVDFLIGTVESTMSMVVGGVAQANKVLFIDSGGTATYIPDVIGEYGWMACFSDDVQAAAEARFAYEELGARTAWLFIDTAQDFCVSLGDSFKKHFLNLGGEILLEDSYLTGDVDVRAQITRLRNLDPQPDLLFIPSEVSMSGIVVKQIREMGINTPIVSGDGFDNPLIAEIAGPEYANNIYFTTHVSFASDKPKVQQFIEDYKKEYQMEPENGFAGLGFDTVMLLADAIKRAGSIDTKAVMTALGETKDLTLVTGNFSFLDGSRIPAKSVTIIELVDGVQTFKQTVMP